MLKIDDIEKLVRDQLSGLVCQPHLATAIRWYRIEGGDEAAQPWHVAGLYADEAKRRRLAFETLYLKRLDTCVVRVFREGKPMILYARKAVADSEKLSLRVEEAGSIFLLHLKKPLPLHSTIERQYEVLAKRIGESVVQALSPIPPPLSLDEIED